MVTDHRTALLRALATASWHLSQIDDPLIEIPLDGLQWMLTVIEHAVGTGSSDC